MTIRTLSRSFAASLTLTTALVGVATDAMAQQIEEIVVTARRRAENLQEVPIVITAFTADSIARKGIESLEDVAKYTNGLILDSGFTKQDTRIVIRGLSPTRGRQNVAILEDDVDISSLAIGTAGGSFNINTRLIDMERIEVVKGPHSALFGRSAFNGAINYIPKTPGDAFEGNASVEGATYGKYEGRVSVSGGVIPGKLAAGITGSYWSQGGMYTSSVSKNGLGGGHGSGVSGSLVFTANDVLSFKVRGEHSDDHFQPEARTYLTNTTDIALPVSAVGPAATFPVSNANPLNATFPTVVGSMGHASDYPAPGPSLNARTGKEYPGLDRKIDRVTLHSVAEFEPVTFTSITHYGKARGTTFEDQFGLGNYDSPAVSGIQETNIDTHTRLMSEEIRLQSNGDKRANWSAGALIWQESVDNFAANIICIAGSGGCGPVLAQAPTAFTPPNETNRDTFHYSGYGSLEIKATDQLSAIGEFRYTKELERTKGPISSGPPGGSIGCTNAAGPGARTINAAGVISCLGTTTLGPYPTTGFTYVNVKSAFWVPRGTIQYRIDADKMIYASVSEGEKPGGFSTIGSAFAAIAANTYLPEKMWVYEAGFKTEWLDKRFQFNGAAYYQNFTNKQVSVQIPDPISGLPSTRVTNAAKAKVTGFEIDAVALPTENLTLTLGYTYNDPKYKAFTDNSRTASAIARAGNCVVGTPFAPVNVNAYCLLDYSGKQLEGAAKHNIQLGGEITGDVSGDLSWFGDFDARYQSKRYTTFENTLIIPAYTNVDVRLGLRNDQWNLTAYCNNVFDDDKLKADGVYIPNWNVSNIPPRNATISGVSALLPDKRQFGIRAAYNF